MAGHSQFKNIMHRKNSQDIKRAKIFTKVIRELTVSARDGISPDSNSRLRNAISIARNVNMPKVTIDRAIKRGFGNSNVNILEVRYEGYFMGGVAVIVEVLTDNRNRTTSEIRSIFSRFNCSIVQNSVSFMFNKCGFIEYKLNGKSEDIFLEKALDKGVTDVIFLGDNRYKILCSAVDLHSIEKDMSNNLWSMKHMGLIWNPVIKTQITKGSARNLLVFFDNLSNNDDVQFVYSNFLIKDIV